MTSRVSSRAPSVDMMKSRKSGGSLISAILRSASPSRDGKSNDASSCTSGISGGGSVGQILQAPHLDLPGIHISRIETLDFDDSSLFSGSGQLAHFIIIHSDASSDFSRISFPNSECSLSGSSRSRSRSSRDSSNFSSRLWDFSPRESDWDVHVPQIPIPGGARDYSLLSPSMPRKGSVVTFDISEPTVRRHSSPASSIRRKDSIMGGECYCYCGKPDCPAMMRHGSTAGREPTNNTWRDDRPGSNGRKKIPGDQSLMSITIDEDDGDEDEDDDETTPLRPENQSAASTAMPISGTSASGCEDRPPVEHARVMNGGRPGVAGRGRPFLKRNNTDDSEVERRMAKIFHEINYSLTDSLEDSKISVARGRHENGSRDADDDRSGSGIHERQPERQRRTRNTKHFLTSGCHNDDVNVRQRYLTDSHLDQWLSRRSRDVSVAVLRIGGYPVRRTAPRHQVRSTAPRYPIWDITGLGRIETNHEIFILEDFKILVLGGHDLFREQTQDREQRERNEKQTTES